MKKIIFLRPAPYNDRIEGLNLIEGFDMIGRQVVDPEINSPSSETIKKIESIYEEYKPMKIYSSPALRCKQTAELLGLPFETSELINEIKFSLLNILSEEELKNNNVNTLRSDLVEAFVENKTLENPDQAILRMRKFIESLKNIDGNILCISNAFIMKFYEIFLKNNCKINNSEIFVSDYDWSKKPYEFLEGFCLEI